MTDVMTQTTYTRKDLHPAMYPHAELAEKHGLFLSHFNSGATGNSNNGFRLFEGNGYRDFFAGGHLAHLRTGHEVAMWLAGFIAAKDKAGSTTRGGQTDGHAI